MVDCNTKTVETVILRQWYNTKTVETVVETVVLKWLRL